ncbi:MAG: hypothetical protein A2Y64_02785 [Candidatus Coatesbacteria bacterium RBG_13_66_14]|uniref:DUF5673 domain-containing protein n=1 Tax=Candidatus Coatesbacteria bacterium RBG_13_66_14 TaxID=1817816 RepID=A0A1F5FEW3_9BACT|nr:MAG: hypothetical protein A2Y64_02785 [Candidatus Coatesbacteria bacterium RBG_13_66_14]
MTSQASPDIVVYRESTVSRASFWITVTVVGLLMIGVVLWGGFRTPGERTIFWACTLTASAALFVGLCFTQLVVTVTQTRLVLAFGVIRKTFARPSIISTEPTFIRLSDSGGYGVRRGRDRVWYWVSAGGPALKIEVADSKKDRVQAYVFTSSHPERLGNILDVAWRS